MIKVYSIFACLFLFSSVLFCQDEEDESCSVPDKKILKLIQTAKDPKSDFRTQTLKFSEAINLNDEKAYSYYEYAEFLFKRAEKTLEAYKVGQSNFALVKNQFKSAALKYQSVIDLCFDFHASAYYNLGYIYNEILGDSESAKSYYESFLNFKNNDLDKYPDDYAEKKSTLNQYFENKTKTDEYASKFYDKPVPFNPVLVKNVSTQKDEYLPIISPDNELLFYTRRGDERSLGDVSSNVKEVFSVSERPNVNQDFNKGKGLMPPFNTNEYDNYGGISLSIDNKEMFICACKEINLQGRKYNNCDIYVTYFKRTGQGGYDYTWTPLENLGPKINTQDGWEAQPTLSADGNTLYFATYRKGSKKTDIYYSNRIEDGTWTAARPVPGPLNTEGHDKAPFLHQDSETMYFVSQVSSSRTGAGEPGNFDIFYSRKDENGEWEEPKNIGYPINSENNEVGLIVSTDGKLAYIATDKQNNSQGYDLYYFDLYEEARPQKILFIKGEVKDDFGDPISDAKLEISYKESGESEEVIVNGDDGKFAAIIKIDNPQDVLVSVKKEGFSFDTEVIKKEEINKLKSSESTFKADNIKMEIGELEIGKSFTIDNILFATSSYELSDDAKFVLNQFIKFLKENPNVSVEIEGHTDDLGDNEENFTLSENRADATMNYLISKGISEDRLESYGFGETDPKVENNNSSNRAKNRRTDFKLTGI